MNIIEFKSFNDNDLVFCMLDTTLSIHDLWAKEITKNQADYTLQNLYNKGYTVLQGTNEDQLLRAAQTSYKYACVISTGTELLNGKRCLDGLINACTDDFVVKGHILDRGDAYYELHAQCYLVNLTNYKKIGSPNIGDIVLGEQHTQIRPFRTTTNIHDDYTPVYIKQGKFEQKYNHKCHGWNIIQQTLEHGYGIYAFGDEIRNNKKHLYPESIKDFYRHVSYVYEKERYCANEFVHTEHTEWSNKTFNNLRQVVAPASGEWYKDMLDISQSCTVVLYDYNLQSLKYWKNNVEQIPNVTYHFVHWDLLGQFVNVLEYLDLDLAENTLINLSNIFCYEGTASLTNTRYRIEKENFIINFFKDNISNAWINFSARSSSGFIDKNDYIQRAKDTPIYNMQDLKKPSWHYSDWL